MNRQLTHFSCGVNYTLLICFVFRIQQPTIENSRHKVSAIRYLRTGLGRPPTLPFWDNALTVCRFSIGVSATRRHEDSLFLVQKSMTNDLLNDILTRSCTITWCWVRTIVWRWSSTNLGNDNNLSFNLWMLQRRCHQTKFSEVILGLGYEVLSSRSVPLSKQRPL